MKDDNWFQTLGQITDVYFPDPNPNSYEIIKFNVSKNSNLTQVTRAVSLKIQLAAGFF